MWQVVKRVPWLPAVVAALVGVAVVLCLGLRAKHSPPITRKVAPTPDTIAAAVRSANEQSTAAHGRRVEAWRQYLRSARSPERLREFVKELTGLEQKFHLALDAFHGPRLPQRVVELFRRQVIDDRQLEADLDATVAACEQFLLEQDRPFYEQAGISREAWTQKFQGNWRWSGGWSGFLAPVIKRATNEACVDAFRFAGTEVAGNLAGDQVKKLARQAGLDTSEEGSFGDLFTGFIADLGAGLAIDAATDATDGIVSRLADEMARAEHALLDGEGGLCWVLRQTEAAHERARNELISTGRNHQE
jgi:hypothetical protein